jgi:hypothetical protein
MLSQWYLEDSVADRQRHRFFPKDDVDSIPSTIEATKCEEVVRGEKIGVAELNYDKQSQLQLAGKMRHRLFD